MKRGNAWTLLSPPALTILLTACAGANSEPPVVVVPSIFHYSAEFQNKLAGELEADNRVPCPPDILVPQCSAWKRGIIDYGYLRDKIRALK